MKRYMLHPLYAPAEGATTTTGTTTTTTPAGETALGSDNPVETPPSPTTTETKPDGTATETTTETKTETTTTEEAPKPWTVGDLAVPANSPFTPEDLEVAFAEGQQLGLTKEQTQAMLDRRADGIAELRGAWLREAQADPVLGGVNFEQTVKDAKSGVEWLFPDATERTAMQQWFNKTGLGNHVAFIRAVARIGAARREDRPLATGKSSSGTPEVLPTAEVLFGKS